MDLNTCVQAGDSHALWLKLRTGMKVIAHKKKKSITAYIASPR